MNFRLQSCDVVSYGLCCLLTISLFQERTAFSAPETATSTYTNPVLNFDAPDPCILRVKNHFYMLHTSGRPPAWPLYESSDMVHWRYLKHLLTDQNKPAWIQDSLWAPELHRVGSTFVLTFTACSHTNGQLCIGMATSDKVDGPFVVQNVPIIAEPVAVLDSHIFLDDDGKNYLIWKRDGPKGGVGGSIRLRQLDDNGTIFAPDSKEVVLLTSDKGGGQEWEKGLVEAPWMLKRDGWYYLIYSGAFIGLDFSYREGVARSRTLDGIFERFDGNPIMGNNERYGGPGHGAFEMDSAGDLWHLYHSHDKTREKGRIQLLDRVVFKDGWPSFGNNGTPSTISQPSPKTGDFPPMVWLSGANSHSLRGTVTLDAIAEDDKAVKSVEFYLAGWVEQPLGKAKLRDGEWRLTFDTSAITDGDYRVLARATDSAGHTVASRSRTVSVVN